MRQWRKLHLDGVSRSNVTAPRHDGHDAGLALQVAFLVAVENGPHQSLLEAVELGAWVSKPGDFHNRILANLQPGARRQLEQVNASCRDVLAHGPRHEVEPPPAQLVVKLLVNEVHLTKIRLTRVSGHPGAMLDGGPQVGVTLDPGVPPLLWTPDG